MLERLKSICVAMFQYLGKTLTKRLHENVQKMQELKTKINNLEQEFEQ